MYEATLQERDGRFYIVLPEKLIEELGWEKGCKLVIEKHRIKELKSEEGVLVYRKPDNVSGVIGAEQKLGSEKKMKEVFEKQNYVYGYVNKINYKDRRALQIINMLMEYFEQKNIKYRKIKDWIVIVIRIDEGYIFTYIPEYLVNYVNEILEILKSLLSKLLSKSAILLVCSESLFNRLKRIEQRYVTVIGEQELIDLIRNDELESLLEKKTYLYA